MGLFRKMTSVSTAGLVDFRSDKERTARNTGKAAKEARKQTALQKQQTRAAERLAALQGPPPSAWQSPTAAPQQQFGPSPVPVAPQGPPAGWYQDPEQADMLCWYDGANWTEFRQPKQVPPAAPTQ